MRFKFTVYYLTSGEKRTLFRNFEKESYAEDYANELLVEEATILPGCADYEKDFLSVYKNEDEASDAYWDYLCGLVKVTFKEVS